VQIKEKGKKKNKKCQNNFTYLIYMLKLLST